MHGASSLSMTITVGDDSADINPDGHDKLYKNRQLPWKLRAH